MIYTIIQLLYYFLFLFTPLIMSKDTSELFEFDKMIFIYIVTVGVLFFWILAMIRNKKIIWKKTPLDIPILLFLASEILSTVFSIDRQTSFFGYYGRFNGGLLSIITYIALFYGFINFFNKEKIIKLMRISLIGSFLVILWGMPGHFGHDMSCWLFTGQFNNTCWTSQFHPDLRMFSTLGQPNWLGAYLAINFFIGLYFLFSKKNNILLYAYLVLNFITVLFTRSRSALAAVGVGFVIFVVFTFYIERQWRKLLFLGLLFLIPIVIFKTDIPAIDKYLRLPSFHQNIKTKTTTSVAVSPPLNITDSLKIREIVWRGAIRLGERYPLFGTGLETFAYSYYFVRPAAHNLTSEWDYLYNKAHNEYLNYLATTGFIGAGTYILMIGGVLILLSRQIFNIQFSVSKQISNSKSKIDNNERLMAISLLAAYATILVTNSVGFSTTTINLFFYLIPAFVLAWKNDLPASSADKNFDARQWFLSLIAFVVAIFAVIYFAQYWLADIAYAKGNAYAQVNDFQQSASYLSQALNLRYEPVYEDKLSYVLANLAVVASYNKQTDIAKKLVTAADLYNQKTIQDSPENVLYWKTKAKNEYLFYQVTLNNQQLADGIYALQEAQKLAPTDPKIPYSLAIYYSLMGDDVKNIKDKSALDDKSLQEVDKALALKPDYEDGYLLKGQLLKKYGDKQQAKQVFQFILTKINPADQTAKKEIDGL